MRDQRERAPGHFCWFNMLTPRAAEAREFFSAIFGWSYRRIPQGDIVLVDGCRIGGLFEDDSALIGAMILVESADATAERVRELGGTAQPPFDIGNDGRLAVCHDPTGAEFDAWEPRAMRGTDAHEHTLGAPAKFALITTDVRRAMAFYSALFGWDSMLARKGSDPRWLTHFLVANVAETEQRAIALGASVLAPGGLRSPQGVEFYVSG